MPCWEMIRGGFLGGPEFMVPPAALSWLAGLWEP